MPKRPYNSCHTTSQCKKKMIKRGWETLAQAKLQMGNSKAATKLLDKLKKYEFVSELQNHNTNVSTKRLVRPMGLKQIICISSTEYHHPRMLTVKAS